MSTFRNFAMFMAASAALIAQNHPGDWKTWVIRSGAEHAVPAPPDAAGTQAEMDWLRAAAMEKDARIAEQIRYWDSGPPSYRWMEMLSQRQVNGQSMGGIFPRAYAYVALAMYDATVAAENAKKQYQRPRPAGVSARVAMPVSSSYPSDYAATAAAAAEVMAYLVPAEAAHFRALAEEAGKSRLYAGVEFPSDYFAGMALGRRVAGQVIAKARLDNADAVWTGAVPTGRCMWQGTNPGNVVAANWKPLLMTTPSEFRPAPPPGCDSADVQAQLAEVRAHPRAMTTPNLYSNARALYWQTNEGVYPWLFAQMGRWMLEDKSSAAEAARAYALVAGAGFDSFIASQDGKFAYWYIRPSQLDPALPTLFAPPNFPSYPSNHSTISTSRAEVLAWLFPERAAAIRALAAEAGDSRIWAGIHFEMDNRAGVELGVKVARKFIAWAEQDGSR